MAKAMEDKGTREMVEALRHVAQAQGRGEEYDRLVNVLNEASDSLDDTTSPAQRIVAGADRFAPGTALRELCLKADGFASFEQYIESLPAVELARAVFDFTGMKKGLELLTGAFQLEVVMRGGKEAAKP